MAVTQIASGSTTTNPTTSLTVATTVGVNSGDKVLVFAQYPASTPTPTATIGGNSMTLDASSARSGAVMVAAFRYDATGTIASGSNIVVTWSGGAAAGAVLTACKADNLAVGALDATAGTNNGLSTTPSTGTSGTPPASDDIVAFAALGINWSGTGTATPDNAYTELTKVEEGVRGNAVYAAYKSFTAAVAAQSETWTATWGSSNWAGLICLYKVQPAGGGGPAVTPTGPYFAFQ